MAQIPPCARDVSHDGTSSTVVVKLQATAFAVQWASASTAPGLGFRAVALVQLRSDADFETDVMYLVITLHKMSKMYNCKEQLLRKLRAPPIEADVEWIRPFDRRLQRLFKWGDCWMDQEDVKKAIQDEDEEALKTYFPALKDAITLGRIEHLGELLDKKQRLAIADDPNSNQASYKQKLYLDHELHGTHCFSEPGKNWECSLCQRMPASRCVCSAQRCLHHQKPPEPENKVAWKCSDDSKNCFFVQDPKWMRKELKVEWIRDDLHEEATLIQFAKAYLKLFRDKRIPEQQRLACLELYRMFNPSFTATKECQLPPRELEAFQRVFNPEAPGRCRWCNSPMTALDGPYCKMACAQAANPPGKCPKCQSEDLNVIEAPHAGFRKGMSRCRSCGFTEWCILIAVGPFAVKRRADASEPQHWTKRRRA